MRLADELYNTPDMADVWSGPAFVRGMLAFEAALARAQAETHLIPPAAAAAISATCTEDSFDVASLFHDAAISGSPAIPLVNMLTERVGSEYGGYVHWGATSQDAIDTAIVLQTRAGLALLVARLQSAGATCEHLADAHRRTLMAGRTLLRQAQPIPFGLKAARWLALITRQIHALASLRERVLVVQLGGAVGTLASLGETGPQVTALVAADLELAVPDLPWHTERDRVAEVATCVGIVAGAMAKIARDVLLLAQSEVAEVAEACAPGKGGSSAMPHKRNPVDTTTALAAARLALGEVPVLLGAMEQPHERAAGEWQAEWDALPRLFCLTACAVERISHALAGLEVHATRMRANLAASGGALLSEALVMELAVKMGRTEAQRVVREALDSSGASDTVFEQAALNDPRIRANLTPEEIHRAFDPNAYLGSSDLFIDRAIAHFRALHTQEAPHGQ